MNIHSTDEISPTLHRALVALIWLTAINDAHVACSYVAALRNDIGRRAV